MAQTIPAGVPSRGTRRAVFIPGTVGNIDAITTAEVTSAENISCYLTVPGLTKSVTQGRIQDSRFCSAQDFQRLGTKTKEVTLEYTFNLNSPANDEARLALEEGSEGVLVEFFQVDPDEDSFAVGDWYQATPIQLGEQMVSDLGDNVMDRLSQETAVTGTWTGFRQLVAA